LSFKRLNNERYSSEKQKMVLDQLKRTDSLKSIRDNYRDNNSYSNNNNIITNTNMNNYKRIHNSIKNSISTR